MSTYRSEFVNANGIRQHYYRAAPENPRLSIVMLHGITDNGMCWVRAADALRGEYDVIMPDARGHGLTDSPETGYSQEDRAADVGELIAALGLDRPVVLGHSMGAMTASLVAALYPERVRAVILEDPAWFAPPAAPPDPARQAEMARGNENWYRQVVERAAWDKEALAALGRKENPNWHPDEFGPWAEAKQQVNTAAFKQTLNTIMARPWFEIAAQIRCPALLITADPARRAIVSPEMAEYALTLMQQGEVFNLPGAGHNIRREAFEPFMAGVRKFLEKV